MAQRVMFDQIVSHFARVSRNGNRVMARCPVHDDSTNSLEITALTDRALMRCHAGCSTETICAAKGLKLADLFFTPRNDTSPAPVPPALRSPLTLKRFALAKGFELDFLNAQGVSEEKGSLVFHYLLMNGQRAARQRIRLALSGDHKFLWNKSDGRPVPYGLWRLDAAHKQNVADLYLVEGESDSLTLWMHGMTALGVAGADNCKLLQAPHVNGFARVLIVRENDHGGEVFEKGCVGRLAELEYAGQVAVIEMAKAEVKDANDLHVKMLGDPGGFESEWTALLEQARAVELPIAGLEIFDAAAIEPKAVQWLWRGRLPIGHLTLFAGAPEIGKSMVTLDIVTRLTTGADWPDGEANGRIVKSLIFSAEDGMADTIIARLVWFGAARGHIHVVKRMRQIDDSGEISRRPFNIKTDLAQVEKYLDKYAEAKLIVIDPVSSYMAGTDTHKNADVRVDVLDKLAELAERREVAVLAVSHLNKAGSNGNASGLDRIAGSIAFPAAARTVWGFTRDLDDPDRRLMLFGKTNIYRPMSGLAFHIVEREGGGIRVQWQDKPVVENFKEHSEREAEQQHDRGGQGRKLDLAKDVWREMLRGGARSYADIEQRARELGISEGTLKRAKWELGVKMTRAGFGGGFKASL